MRYAWVKVIQFRQKPLVRCLDPQCKTNYVPQLDLGECPTCKKDGRPDGHLLTQVSKNLKRFVRCTNYDECQTSYPLPQRGNLEPTGETCEPCGAPIVIVHTGRGPWRVCIDRECSSKEEKPSAKKPAKKPAKKSSRSTAKKSR